MLVIITPKEFKKIKYQLTRNRDFICKSEKVFQKAMLILKYFPGLERAKIIKAYENETCTAGVTNPGHLV